MNKIIPLNVDVLSPEEAEERLKETVRSIAGTGFDVDMLDHVLFLLYINHIKDRYGSLVAVRHANMMIGQFCGDPSNFKEIYH